MFKRLKAFLNWRINRVICIEPSFRILASPRCSYTSKSRLPYEGSHLVLSICCASCKSLSFLRGTSRTVSSWWSLPSRKLSLIKLVDFWLQGLRLAGSILVLASQRSSPLTGCWPVNVEVPYMPHLRALHEALLALLDGSYEFFGCLVTPLCCAIEQIFLH